VAHLGDGCRKTIKHKGAKFRKGLGLRGFPLCTFVSFVVKAWQVEPLPDVESIRNNAVRGFEIQLPSLRKETHFPR